MRLVALLLLTSFVAIARADVGPLLAKARAQYAPESVLTALRSIHYVGTAETESATPEGPRMVTAQIEIFFQAPFQYRMVVTLPDRIEITALDEYEAWQRLEDPKEPTRWRMTLLSGDQVKRLRATTWENLSFHGPLNLRGGRVDDLGQATVDGVQAQKIGFIHDAKIAFYRYFDPSTGKLLLTETDQGEQIREEGEISAGGVRFSRKIITSSRLADGTTRSVTVTFSKIEVNESYPANLFAIPPVSTR